MAGLIEDGDIVYRLWDNACEEYVTGRSDKSMWHTKSGPAGIIRQERNNSWYPQNINGVMKSVSTFDESRYEIHKFRVQLERLPDDKKKKDKRTSTTEPDDNDK